MGKVIAIPPISKILESALDLAAKGIRVFPLAEGTSVPPKGFFGFQKQATTDPDKIREWWAENPNYNVAVATGQGLTVVDVDVKSGKQGAESLETLELMGLPLDGFRVKTPSGGEHIYLFSDHPHRNSVEKLPDLPGIDIRGEGGYVVGPGSVRTDFPGKPYRASGERFPKAPDWLDKMLIDAAPKHADRTEQPLVELDLPHNVANAIIYLEQRAPEAIEGAGGNDATYKVAGRLRDYGLSEGKAWEIMLDHWNEQKAAPMWDPEALLDVVQNAYRYATGAWGGEDTSVGLEAVDDIADSRKSSAVGDGEEAGSAAENAETTVPKRRNRFLTYDQMITMPHPEWLVEGLVPAHAASLMFGKSNSFKSFAAIDLALSIVSGRSWHGQRVKQGRAALVATEGANGVGRFRVPGWFEHHQVPLELRRNFFLMPHETAIDDKKNVDALLADVLELGEVDLIVFDIFGGTMFGSETEDTTARAWVHGVQRLMRKSGAATLTVAHTGWVDQTRARMHTHFWGSFDTRLKVEGDKDARTACLSVERHKDFDSTGSWGFHLETSHGTLVPVLDESAKPSVADRLSPTEKTALHALHDVIAEHGQRVDGAGWPTEPVVDVKVWRNRVQPSLSNSSKPDAQKRAFNRAKKALLGRGLIGEHENHIWAVL